jgi:hypothetical protein
MEHLLDPEHGSTRTGPALRSGLRAIHRRPGLALLVYGVNLVLAVLLSVPVYIALDQAVSLTGFGRELAAGFDVVLWADIMEKAGPTLGALLGQLLWVVPLFLIVRVALHAGLIHALQGSGVRSFWTGVGRYATRALLLSVMLAPAAAVLALVAGGLTLFISAFWSGEIAEFWTFGVIGPALLVSALAVADLMQDYGRIALVVDERSIGQAWRTAIGWPFRHGPSVLIYAAWLGVAAVLLLLPILVDAWMPAATPAALGILFVLQQAMLLLRAFVTVGWMGSQVAYFEQVCERERPLIAMQAPAIGAPVGADGPSV